MAERETEIFRREALEHRSAQKGPGDVVRVAPRWTTVAFFCLVGVVLAALIAGSMIQIDRFANGTAARDASGRLVILIPAAVAPEIPAGHQVEIGDETTEVVSSGNILDPSEVRDRYGVEVALPSIPVVTAMEARVEGAARVLVEREPVVVSLIPGLKGLLGDG